MSYQAVNTVMTRWTHLNDQPFRALAFMAHMAHSDHQPPPYFAGHRALAQALGMDPDHPRTFERVRRVLRTLEAAGAVVAGMEGKAGQRRDYALTLDPELTYRPSGVRDVHFTRHVSTGDAVREETYPVQLTAWESVPRQDPRPQPDPPHEMGGDLPREMGGIPPRHMGGDLPREMGPTSHATWDPRSTTHNHSKSKPRQAETGIAVASQPKPSTRASTSTPPADAVGRTEEGERRRQAQDLEDAFPELKALVDSSGHRPKASSSRKKPSTPIPDGWAPTQAHRDKAAERRLDLEREAEAFRLHAEAHDRRAVRWDAAFSQWLLKAAPAPAADPGTAALSAWNSYRPVYDHDEPQEAAG